MLKKIARYILRKELSALKKIALERQLDCAHAEREIHACRNQLLESERLRREEQKAYGSTISIVQSGQLQKAIDEEVQYEEVKETAEWSPRTYTLNEAAADGDEELKQQWLTSGRVALVSSVEPTTNNPKEFAGLKKPARCHVPHTSVAALHAAHNNGALKYGHFNWRGEGVDVNTYLSACERHIEAFKMSLLNLYGKDVSTTVADKFPEGVSRDQMLQIGAAEIDPQTGVQVPHLGAAMACLSILHDAFCQGKLIDNYSPPEVKPKPLSGKPSNTES